MIAVLFATEMEAKPFRERCSRADVRISVAQQMGSDAAAQAAVELITQGVDVIINAGVCGALEHGLNRGDIFVVDQVFYQAADHSLRLPALPEGFVGKRLVTVEEPVFQAVRKAALAAFADLVDMEGFAIASVCQQTQIPCLMVKGVTDFGDERGKGDIREHLETVSTRVAKAVLQVIYDMAGPEPL
jgi:nucleoside phosphorylase